MSYSSSPNPRRQSYSYAPHQDYPFSDYKKTVSRENKFIVQYGSRLHSYGRDKAPYPVSYNREDLELWNLDYELLRHTRQGVGSFVNFKGKHPKRCLDIGTGLGTWIIDAAREWPECTFVGYDLMNVQLPKRFLPADVADRIDWVHGNLLRTKLPFEEEEFDHIHIGGLAFGVPENKWTSLYEEIRRVMRTGGTIEQIEEDAIFPVLPRWFTEPLHSHTRGPYAHFPGGSAEKHAEPDPDQDPHEHALLESLFRDVFDHRFINPTPTSCLLSYFSTTFGHVISPPVLARPMPPLAPLAPLPSELRPPEPVRPPSPSPPSSESHGTDGHTSLPAAPGGSTPDLALTLPTASASTLASTVSAGYSTAPSSLSLSPSRAPSSDSDVVAPLPRTPVPAADLRRDSTSMGVGMNAGGAGAGGGGGVELFPMESLLALEEHSLNMALFRALGLVLAVKEAMWEELLGRVARGDRQLVRYGWGKNDYSESASRVLFDGLVEQYRKDVRARVALWHSMVLSGWAYPRQDPLTKAELMEEERLRQDILEARRNAKEEDLEGASRFIRLMVGVKMPDAGSMT